MASRERHDGYLLLDHRACFGEVPTPTAEQIGMNPAETRIGALFEAATMCCAHCSGLVVLNPERKRARALCHSCDKYICDVCKAASTAPGYVHRSFEQLSEMVLSGRYTVSGPSSAPIITPTTPQEI